MKRQPSEGEKIIASEATDKGLISKIYKQFIYLSIRKTTNLIKKKMGKKPKQVFLQRRNTDRQQTHVKMLNIAHYSIQFSHSVVSDSL